MTKWYCYVCRRADGKSNGACIYIDPIGELHTPPLTCNIDNAEWTTERHDEWCDP